MAVFLLILKIIGIVLLAVVGLIIVVLCIPAFVYIRFDNELSADARFLLFKFKVYPSDKEEPGIVERLVLKFWRYLIGASGKSSDARSLSDISDEAGFKALFDDRGASGAISFLWQVIVILFGRFVKVLRGVAVSKFNLKIDVAGDDAAEAALRYGKLCGIIYPLLSFVFQNVKTYKQEIDIRPELDERLEYDKVDLNVTLRICPIIIAAHIIALLFDLIVSETKRQVAENLAAAEVKSN